MVHDMLQRGMDHATIAEVTGLDEATVLSIKMALSFHTIPTPIQPAQPIKDKHISAKGNSPVDLRTIANNIIMEDVHFKYQSFVSLGVLNFMILN